MIGHILKKNFDYEKIGYFDIGLYVYCVKVAYVHDFGKILFYHLNVYNASVRHF